LGKGKGGTGVTIDQSLPLAAINGVLEISDAFLGGARPGGAFAFLDGAFTRCLLRLQKYRRLQSFTSSTLVAGGLL
jgi:hypothetical protein